MQKPIKYVIIILGIRLNLDTFIFSQIMSFGFQGYENVKF